MSLVTLDKLAEFRGKTLEEKMREKHLHEQMVSCIDFVIEKASQMDPDDPILRDLENILEVFDRRHEQVVSSIAVNENRSGANNRRY